MLSVGRFKVSKFYDHLGHLHYSYEGQASKGDVVKYGEKVTLTTLPDGVGGGLFLHSERATFMKCSKNSRQQEVLLMDTPSYDVAW